MAAGALFNVGDAMPQAWASFCMRRMGFSSSARAYGSISSVFDGFRARRASSRGVWKCSTTASGARQGL